MDNIIPLFPYTMGLARMEIDHKKAGTYRAITLLLLYELAHPGTPSDAELLLLRPNEHFKAKMRKRLLNRPKFNPEEMGKVLAFPTKQLALPAPDGDEPKPEL